MLRDLTNEFEDEGLKDLQRAGPINGRLGFRATTTDSTSHRGLHFILVGKPSHFESLKNGSMQWAQADIMHVWKSESHGGRRREHPLRTDSIELTSTLWKRAANWS